MTGQTRRRQASRGATMAQTTLTERTPAMIAIPPIVGTTVLWMASPHSLELSAVAGALALLGMPWGSYVLWRGRRDPGIPVFAFVGAAYWLYFALPLFVGSRVLPLVGATNVFEPTEGMVAETIRLTVIGVGALWLGMQVPVSVWIPADLPDVIDHPRTWSYVRTLLLAGILLKLYSGSQYALGEGGRQLMVTLAGMVPAVAFILLLMRHYAGRSTRADKVAILLAVTALLGGGLASGWLGASTSIVLSYGCVSLMRNRRLPWRAIITILLLVLFLQVGKNDFRNVYWVGEQSGSVVERALFWLSRSAARWGTALDEEAGVGGQALISESVERVSLLNQVAQVLDATPRDVPFQEGATYRYLAITWIPRALWPNKPSVNDANRFYQVAYGLTEARDLDSVSIAVGYMAEGYMNFGWAGALGIMFLSGVALGTFERLSGMAKSSSLLVAVSLALIPGLVAVESQLGQYLAGVVQQTVLTVVVFMPVARRRNVQSAQVRVAIGGVGQA